MKKYDVIIIGSGGGTKLRPATELGKKVAIIEKDSLGGTCLNRGCIPSKMLIHAADLVSELQEFPKHNLQLTGEVKVDWPALIKRVNSSVKSSSAQIGEAYKENPNLDYYHGKASFKSNYVVTVNGQDLTAPKIIIAVGTRPSVPKIKGLEGTPYMTSTEALKSEKQPNKMIIIGGGYIATELGYFYGALGTDVHFVVRSKFLKNEDQEVIDQFTSVFTKQFPTSLHYWPTEISYQNGEFTVKIVNSSNQSKTLKSDALFIATGTQSNSDTLHLENTDIKIDKKAYIETNEYLETSVPGIYAIGDVNGHYFFRHSVNYEGEQLFKNLFSSQKAQKIVYPPMPHAVFTNPQIAGVGPTEEELKEQNIPYFIGKNSYQDSAMGGDALQSDHGFCKLIFHQKTQKLLAAHIIGKESSNMIHTLIAYLNLGATLDQILETIYIHPALPEIVRNAARKAQASL